ncbi:MAG: DUF1254 domain-containing protein [Phenylobacterium sp.]|nr:MAG: DUF1254 domain-containing protein [Phenylobacterium sp.]
MMGQVDRRGVMLGGGAAAFAAVRGAAAARAPVTADGLRPAFFYAFPLYEMARIAQERTAAAGGTGGLNTITHRAQLLDHRARQVSGPNNDTIYSSAFLDLAGGPLDLIIPTERDRYFCVAFMDAFTDNFAYVGARATHGRGGRFWVVGPHWRGAPPRGAQVIRAPTNDVWMLARILVDGPGDLPAAQALQRQIALVAPAGRPPPGPWSNRATHAADGANFLAVVNEVLARSAGGGSQLARATRFSSVGVGTSRAPDADLLAAWNAWIPAGLAELQEAFQYRDLVVDGWSYQEPGVGEFGTKDRLRAAVALGGIAALGEAEAMYFHATRAADGTLLDGRRAHRWRVPAGGVPADAFWSLSMYAAEPDGRFFFADNPIHRYAIGDRTPGLVVAADGSLDILIQHEPPDGVLAANWLPAPAGPMRLALRAYMPRPELRRRRWRLPPLQAVA